MTSSASRSVSIQSKKGHGSGGAAHDRHTSTLYEEVSVMAESLGTWCVDQQSCHILIFRTVQRLEILHEARAGPIEVKSVDERGKMLAECVRRWGRQPPFYPSIIVLWGGGGGQ